MGSQRIVSKLSNSGIFAASPVTATQQQARYTLQTSKIIERFDSLGVVYNGIAQTGGLVSSNPDTTASSYFYHSDHLGSSSLITDGTGALVQHIEYVPFGETFIDERNGNWSTPYLFNGKEKDEETGLHYFHARYYDSRTSVWLSVDPLAEKYFWTSSYIYCLNNPVKYTDPTGMEVEADSKSQINILNTLSKRERKYVRFDENGVLDKKLLKKSWSLSVNMRSLKRLAKSETVYNFQVVEKTHEGKSFYDNSDVGGNFFRGVTEMPGAKSDASPDNKVYILVGDCLSESQQATTTAHEAYAHGYLFDLTGDYIKASHTYDSKGRVVWDEELKQHVFESTRVPTNKRLESRIKRVEKQAKKNYEKSK
jgi:RHS repeat-associated protein